MATDKNPVLPSWHEITTTKATPPDSDAPSVQPSSTKRLSPYRGVLYAILALVSLAALHGPLGTTNLGIPLHVCGKPMTVEQKARQILAHNPLIDGHIDLPILLRALYHNRIDNDEWRQRFENGTMPGQVDLYRLSKGQSGGAFWSVFAPCPDKGDDFSDANLAPIVQYTLDQIDVMDRVMEAFPHDFAPRVKSRDARAAFNSGKLISPLGVEGLHQIGNHVANLRRFHELGVRYATLTHNCHNKYADAALLESPLRKAEPKWNGVSPLGRELIHEMNRIGMIVDLSHVSEDTMFDVLGGRQDWPGSLAPIIFSHSSAYSICPHPRNVKDSILQLVRKRNSVVMVNVSPDFISCRAVGNPNGLPEEDPANATLDRVVEHILHIGNLIGFDHVGIGTDFDGIDSLPKGFDDVTKYPDLIAALLRAGVSDTDAAKIAGGNVLRVWHDVDAVSARLKAESSPVMEDSIRGPAHD
ncbi:uncharacterized protein UV8b_03181 [Ustilaginoidea virens]|uniref:Dipeptidase n=1 Tax=Ustilaginoidea virens TaxID=1159556 RepID=A0A8E5HNT6_USTVR|nr:uncharacterized protein UV8b_03181 [Ustilaginoidea virens]QUC18940.1 hypothetical protein UV8b_03181 [Ustilaginoidea virens]